MALRKRPITPDSLEIETNRMSLGPIHRRTFATIVLGGLGAATSACLAVPDRRDTPDPEVAALEAEGSGRLGVVAIDTATGRSIAHRADERFPMCSTHKIVTGAAILARIEHGRLEADRHVPYGPDDLLDYAPVTKAHVAAGFMTVEALCEATVRWSDNTADNLLLRLLGGPGAWTRYARSIGDGVSRLDRYEPALDTAIPGDPRDTSTPRAMARTLSMLILGNTLGDASRARLKGWMLDSEITAGLFRAGIPAGWHVADKSGSGANGTRNDVGLLYPPRSAPIIVSAFYTGSPAPIAAREHVIARCAAIAVRRFSREA